MGSERLAQVERLAWVEGVVGENEAGDELDEADVGQPSSEVLEVLRNVTGVEKLAICSTVAGGADALPTSPASRVQHRRCSNAPGAYT